MVTGPSRIYLLAGIRRIEKVFSMSQKNPQVLIVEDDEAALFGYEKYLGKNGYAVRKAPSLAEAKTISDGTCSLFVSRFSVRK